MCDACFRALIPARRLRSPLGFDVLRAPAAGMVKPPADPNADRLRAKKQRKADKAALRKAFRDEGPMGATKLFLTMQAQPAPSDECAACLALNRHVA